MHDPYEVATVITKMDRTKVDCVCVLFENASACEWNEGYQAPLTKLDWAIVRHS
jgi:hypothetical protein